MEKIAEALAQFHPVVQALLAPLFTWGVTALVLCFPKIKQEVLDAMLE
ncbi:MAG: hypothetical protein HRU12_11095 [Phaeodactylibacter sp.]|nr:hypothetical protein [Phaeodactylibacter sp.]